MPKQISYTLNNEELKQIEAAMRDDPRAEVVRRATTIHALHLGHKPEIVAQMVKAGKSTMNTWHRQWRSGGIEFGVLKRQCLSQRFSSRDLLSRAIQPWFEARNRLDSTIHWQFSVDDAHLKLHHLYPSFDP